MQTTDTARMPLVNRLKKFLLEREITVYRFRADVGMSETRAYKLVNDPEQLPSGALLGKICDRYGVTPNDILEVIPKDPNEKTSDSPVGESEV